MEWLFWSKVVGIFVATVIIGGYILVLRERVAKAYWILAFLLHGTRSTNQLLIITNFSTRTALYVWLYRAQQKDWIYGDRIQGLNQFWLTPEGKEHIWDLVRL